MWWIVAGAFAVGVFAGVTAVAFWLRGSFRAFR